MGTKTRELDETKRAHLRIEADSRQVELEARYRDRDWGEVAVEYFEAQRLAGRAEIQRLMESVGMVRGAGRRDLVPARDEPEVGRPLL